MLIEAIGLLDADALRAAAELEARLGAHARRGFRQVLVAHAHIGPLLIELGVVVVGLQQSAAHGLGQGAIGAQRERRDKRHRDGEPNASPSFHRSLIAREAVSTSGENKYSRMRRLPVLISTVTAMPADNGIWRPRRSSTPFAHAT